MTFATQIYAVRNLVRGTGAVPSFFTTSSTTVVNPTH
jgi:hypothetical protein